MLLGDATICDGTEDTVPLFHQGDSEGSAKPWEPIPTRGKPSTVPCSDTASAAKTQRLQQCHIIFIPGQTPTPPGEQRHQNLDGRTPLSVPVPSVRAEGGVLSQTQQNLCRRFQSRAKPGLELNSKGMLVDSSRAGMALANSEGRQDSQAMGAPPVPGTD